MQDEKQEKTYEVLTIQEYLDRRKEKLTIDQTETECYDT